MDAHLLDLMPDGAVVVNTARSALIDSSAMVAALESGRVRTYAVDAFDQEPPVLDTLLRHPRTVMTAHLGGFTDASIGSAGRDAVAHIVARLA